MDGSVGKTGRVGDPSSVEAFPKNPQRGPNEIGLKVKF